jgi:phospholipid/cholesterol/gamma-HCH transport system substrate-binding protein
VSRTVLQLKRYGRSLLIFIALMLVGLAAGFYILGQQRLPNPFNKTYRVNAAFPSAAGVVPGLGEPVDISGVHVGEILNVKLVAGQGVITMEINKSSGVPHLYKNASAALTPNTPLGDMYVDISPGSASAGVLPEGGTIPVENTTSPTNSDELLDELDLDTREWFTSLIGALTTGVTGRGTDIKNLLLTLGPTATQARTISDLLARRRTDLSSLVHNLSNLTQATSRQDTQLGQVVDQSNTTIGAIASQDTYLAAAIRQLPGVLATTRSTFANLTTFANQLTPTATALVPLARHLPTTLKDTKTLVSAAALLPLDKAKAFEAATAPLGPVLTTLGSRLDTTVPELQTSFRGLQYITNELAYNPGNGNPGFLYWLAWFAHNVQSFVGNSDGNGPVWRLLTETTCSSLSDASTTTQSLLNVVLSQLGCT